MTLFEHSNDSITNSERNDYIGFRILSILLINPASWKTAGGAGVLLGILGGGVSSGSPNPDPISDQNRVQTWPLGRNYVIIT